MIINIDDSIVKDLDIEVIENKVKDFLIEEVKRIALEKEIVDAVKARDKNKSDYKGSDITEVLNILHKSVEDTYV